MGVRVNTGDRVVHCTATGLPGTVMGETTNGQITVSWDACSEYDAYVDNHPEKNLILIKSADIEPSEVRATDPETGGMKGRKLEEFALIPVFPRQEEARVYGYGANKYEPNNWRKGYAWSWSLSALHRHIALFESGESHDPESGLHHLAHAKFHLNTLIEFDRLKLGTDDRQTS